MTVDEAKKCQEKIIAARNELNTAIREGKDKGVYSELEICQITREQIGQYEETYETLDIRCFVDPTKLD